MKRRVNVLSLSLLFVIAQANGEGIPAGYRQVAAEYGVPAPLLYAVALTESGQTSRSNGQLRPWPWTLNINGTGHYYGSRAEAWRALVVTLETADHSVDIGLMQINWGYHQQALHSPWQALDPYHNLRVAAAILGDCVQTHTDWRQAAGCYHAPHAPARAARYGQRVARYLKSFTPSHLFPPHTLPDPSLGDAP